MFFKQLPVFLGLSAVATSHFVLQVPLSLGFDDTVEDVAPCDNFDPTDRSGGVTDWPVAGSSVVVLSTHLNVLWDFKAALLSDITAGTPTWRPITLQLSQKGVGTFCEPQIPGPPEWVGLDAVLQVVQHGPDGTLYQCAAIRFQDLPFAGPDAACSNDTGVEASWIGGVTISSSRSVILPSSSSSTPEGTTFPTSSTPESPTSSSTTAPTGPTSSSTTTPTGPTSSSTITVNGPTSSSSSILVRPKSSSSTTVSRSTSTSVSVGPTTSARGKESTSSGVSVAASTKITTSKAATTVASSAPSQTPGQFTGASNTIYGRVEAVFLGCSLAIFVTLGM